MHPLSHRWRIAAAVIPVILLAACGRDATPVSPDQSQRAMRDILADGPLAYNVIGELELQVGQQSQLKTRNSRNVRGATWTSSNPAVASVNTNGVVAGVATGESFVTLSGFGVSETYRVGVSPTPTVTDLSISPATGTALAPGQSRQFTRSVTWSDGATRAATVTYSVSNAGAGTINSNGLFTAGQLAGTFSIIASCACGSVTPLADTAQVSIASLSSLAISPKTVTLPPSGTQSFVPSGVWSNGATVTPVVTFGAEGGAVTASGVYTAPSNPGTYRVIIRHVGGTLRDTAFVTVAAPQLTSLTISPKSVSLAAGATQQFGAAANWSTGATTLPPVTYSTTGGTISSTGLYTAPTTGGTYRVIVAHTGGTLRDTATVTVAGSTPTLTSLVISPKTTALTTGGTRQFSASAVWSNGTTTLPPLTWSVIGSGSGTVSSTGLYTAPATAGTYRVIVAHTGGTRRDTATLTVTTSTSSSSPTPAPGSGVSWQITRDFNSGVLGTQAEGKPDGFDDIAGHSVYSKEKSVDGSQVVRMSIDSATTGFGRWGGAIKFPTRLVAGDEIWIDLQLYLPVGFSVATDVGSLKFLRVHTKTASGVSAGYNDLYIADEWRTTQYRFIKEGQNQWYNHGAKGSLTRGVWHRFTMHLRFDSVPRENGGKSQVRIWQNGALLLDEHRVRSLASPTDYSDSFLLFTHWNGSAPRTQSAWVDNLRLSTVRPSWATGLQGVDQY